MAKVQVVDATTFLIPKMQIRQIEITLIGDSPLICHNWSKKSQGELLDKQLKRAKAKKEAKDPAADFEASLYRLDDGGYGFPCVAFKSAAVSACRFVEGVKFTEARGAFHVVGRYARLEGEPTPRMDMVRVGMGTADVRFRGEFREWRTRLTIKYNAASLSEEQIINLFETAGFGVGVGEWRPEKDGSYGMFHVARDGE